MWPKDATLDELFRVEAVARQLHQSVEVLPSAGQRQGDAARRVLRCLDCLVEAVGEFRQIRRIDLANEGHGREEAEQ